MKIKLEYNLSADFLKSVLVSAFESGVHGVQSWGTATAVARTDKSGNYIAVKLSYDLKEGNEGDRKGRCTVGLKAIAAGIVRLLDNKIDMGSDLRGRLAVAVVTSDAGEIDGPLADCIVQAAIFGDVIYG